MTGYHLEIDLARGNIERVETDPRLTELHLGRLGASVKIYWDRVLAETKAFDPENLLIFSTAFHAPPRCSNSNPARARIQVISHRLKNIWLPVFAGEHAPAECMGRDKYVIDGKEYEGCAFCRDFCPSRDLSRNPIPVSR